MALAWTYSTFKEALRKWPKTNSTNLDYEAQLDNIIGLGELRVIRELNLEIFDVTDESLLLDEGERLVTKPSALVTTRSLRIGQVISSAVEQAADDDSISLAQVAPNVQAALSITGAAASGGTVSFTVARRVTVTETLLGSGGIEVIITGTDQNSFAVRETVLTLKNAQPAFSQTMFLTVTSVQGRFGDGTRQIKVGGAVARGAVVIGETWPLELRSKDFCQAYAPDRREVNRPIYFNEHSTTQWELVDSADVDYAVISRHVARPASLSNANSTTWLHTNVPDLMLSATLLETEHFLKADDRYADIAKKYYGDGNEPGLLQIARMELRNLIRVGDRGPFAPTMSPG